MQKETCGIYVITERATQRPRYVGQSIGIEGRWGAYKNRFPKERFDYRIIQECLPADLNFWEKYYICALKTHWTEGGENQNWGGQHWPKPEEPVSPATRAKIAATQKGRPKSEEMKAKVSATLQGRPGRVQSEEEKAKRSATLKGKGKPMSEEAKAKSSAALKGRVAHNKGKPMSEEAQAKSSAAAKAREALKRAAKAAAEADPALEALLIPEIISIPE